MYTPRIALGHCSSGVGSHFPSPLLTSTHLQLSRGVSHQNYPASRLEQMARQATFYGAYPMENF